MHRYRRLAISNKKTPPVPPSFQALIQTFFAEHITQQRALSPCTVAAYRDAFMLFLNFTTKHCGKSPASMTLADITPEVILAFLDHLEQAQIEPDWDLAAQPAPDFDVDQRVNW